MIWILFICSFVLAADDFHIALVEARDQESEERIANTILNGFFEGNGENIRPKLKPILVEFIKKEEPQVIVILERMADSHTPISQSSDPISSKVLELFVAAMEEVMQEEEQKTERISLERDNRCKRSTTIILASALTLIGTTVAAIVSSAVTAAID